MQMHLHSLRLLSYAKAGDMFVQEICSCRTNLIVPLIGFSFLQLCLKIVNQCFLHSFNCMPALFRQNVHKSQYESFI